jgi:uncharacterized protein (DUF736 family)
MPTIGFFSHQGDIYYGNILTLGLSAKVKIVPSGLEGKKSPQHLVLVGEAQVGAGWNRKNREGGSYVSVKIDDPSFPAPVFANLIACGDVYHLIWRRDDAHQSQES